MKRFALGFLTALLLASSMVGAAPTYQNLGPLIPGNSVAPATTAKPGSMSAADKTKLDGLPSSAVPTSALSIVAAQSLASQYAAKVNKTLTSYPIETGFSGWTATTTGTCTINLSDNSDYYGAGTTSALLTTDGLSSSSGDNVYMTSPTYGTAWDLTNSEFVIALKVTNYATLKTSNWLSVYAGDTALANYYNWLWNNVAETSTTTYLTPDGTWLLLRLPWSMATTHNTPTRSAITVIRIRIFDRYVSGGAVSPAQVRFGYIGMAQDVSHLYANGVITWTLDDGWATQYTIAAPIFDSYDIKPTLHLIDDRIGVASYMTLGQIQTLQTHGWIVGTHASTLANHDTNYVALGTTAAAADLATTIAYHQANGLGWRNFAYPGGNFDGPTEAAIMALGIRSARILYVPSAGTFSSGWPPVDPGKIMALSMSSVTVAQAKTFIDTVKSNKAWGVFAAHQFGTGASSGTTLGQADLRAILQYQVAQGVTTKSMEEMMP